MPHIYLSRNLEMFGSEESALALVDSQLSERTQAIQVQASYMEFWEVIKGVIQGGPSAPRFFGDYTVDIPMSTFRCKERD